MTPLQFVFANLHVVIVHAGMFAIAVALVVGMVQVIKERGMK